MLPLDDLPQWARTLAVFDTETTGIDVEQARIVTASLAVIDAGGAVVERTDWLADPGIEIPAPASAVHGITTERARAEGRPAAEVTAELLAVVAAIVEREIPLVVYNAPYDLTILNREALRYGLAPLATHGVVVDPLVIDKEVDRYRRGKRTLEVSSQHYGVVLSAAHDAGADAIAAGHLAQAIARTFAAKLPESGVELHRMQVNWALSQAESFTMYMRRERDPNFTANGEWPLRSAP
ncbi:MAG: exonuclease domain-containing protein [Microbacteriaceae bacterium]